VKMFYGALYDGFRAGGIACVEPRRSLTKVRGPTGVLASMAVEAAGDDPWVPVPAAPRTRIAMRFWQVFEPTITHVLAR
jgi:hypothetical protein